MLKVTVKNYAGSNEDKVVFVDKTPSQYERDLISAGYKGVGVSDAIDTGLIVQIDQFAIEVQLVKGAI